MMTRREAREEIIKKANKITSVGSNRILKMKNINEAVKIVRFHRLVDNDVLEAAGFNKMKESVGASLKTKLPESLKLPSLYWN